MRYVNRGEESTHVEDREAIGAGEPIDRVYFATPAVTRVDDRRRVFMVEQRGFTDTVVWNPGPARTAQMADMAPDGFRHMLCVEAAAIDPPVRLPAGAAWTARQALTAMPPTAE
jgi:glucose-6-phosphate 1-epimerase